MQKMKPLDRTSLLARITFWAIPAAILFGLWGGRSGAATFAAMNQPIEWRDLPFVIVGTAAGVFLVIGFQALTKKPQFVRLGWWFLGISSLYFGSMGAMVLFLAFGHQATIQPADLFFLSAAFGMFLGLGMVRLACRSAFSALIQ